MSENPPAQLHSSTSVAAANAIRPHVKSMRQRVYEALVEQPSTDQQLAHRLGLSENSVRPRRVELERDGKIRACGKVPTTSGRQAWQWSAV